MIFYANHHSMVCLGRGGRGQAEHSGPQAVVDPIIADRQKVVHFITRLGDKSSASLEDNMRGCARELQDLMGQHRRLIIETLLKSVIALPTKTPIYGTLTGLLALHDSNFAKDVLHKTRYELQVALRRQVAGAPQRMFNLLILFQQARIL